MKYKLVVFDMDGVIFDSANSWLGLHKKLGTLEKGKMLTHFYLVKNYEKLVEEVVGKLWKGKSAKGYFDMVKNMKYIKGVKETIKELKKRGIKTAVITSGPRHIAERAKKELGIDYIYFNELVIKNGIITGEFFGPVGFDKKADKLREVCKKENISLKETVTVGDDENDVPKAKISGLAIAFDSKSEKLNKVCNIIITKKDPREILKYI